MIVNVSNQYLPKSALSTFIVLGGIIVLIISMWYYNSIQLKKNIKVLPLHIPYTIPKHVKYYNPHDIIVDWNRCSNDISSSGVRLLNDISSNDIILSDNSSNDSLSDISSNDSLSDISSNDSLSDISSNDISQTIHENIIPFNESKKIAAENKSYRLMENGYNKTNSFCPFNYSDISSLSDTDDSCDTLHSCMSEGDNYSYEYKKAEQAFNIKHIKSMSSRNVLISDIQKKTKLTLNEMVDVFINGDSYLDE